VKSAMKLDVLSMIPSFATSVVMHGKPYVDSYIGKPSFVGLKEGLQYKTGKVGKTKRRPYTPIGVVDTTEVVPGLWRKKRKRKRYNKTSR